MQKKQLDEKRTSPRITSARKRRSRILSRKKVVIMKRGRYIYISDHARTNKHIIEVPIGDDTSIPNDE